MSRCFAILRHHFRLPCLLVLSLGLCSCRATSPAADATERAEKLVAAGLVTDARAVLQEAIQKDPGYAPSYRTLAEISEEVKDRPAAITYWGQYLERKPDATHAWCRRAMLEMLIGQEVAAMEDAGKELKQDPECARAHLAMGLLFVRKGNAHEALTHLEKASKAYPQEPRVQLVYGRVLAMAGQYDAAEPILKRLTDTDKPHAEPYYWLGYIHARRSTDAADAAQAEPLLRRALALQPGMSPATFELGRFLVNHHRAAEAVPLLKQALSEDKNDPAPAFSLVEAYNQLGDTAASTAAQADFKKRSDLATRRKSLLRQLAVAPRDAELNRQFGNLERERGDIRSAISFLEAAHSLAPNSAAIEQDLEHARQMQAPGAAPTGSASSDAETVSP